MKPVYAPRPSRHAPLHLTRRSVDEVYSTMRDSRRILLDAGRDGGSSASLLSKLLPRGIAAAEVLGGATLVGIIAARLGTANIPRSSIPLGPVAGLFGHALAVFHEEIGIPEAAVEHIHSVSNGFIGGWGALYGLGIGQGMREKAGLPPADVRVGGLPSSARTSMGCESMQYTRMGCPPQATPSQMSGAPPNTVRPLSEAELAALYRRAA